MMSIGMHCRLLGRPGRFRALQRFLDHVAAARPRLDLPAHRHRASLEGDASVRPRAPHSSGNDRHADARATQRRPQAEFAALLDGTYEHSPWIAERGVAQAPVRQPRAAEAGARRGRARRGARRAARADPAHPELAGKAMVSKTLTAESTNEQGKAGLTDCTPEEFATIQQPQRRLQRQVRLAVHPRGARAARHGPVASAEIIATFERRARQPPRLRARRMPAQHPSHRRAPARRQVRRRARRSATWCGTGPRSSPCTATPATPSTAS